MAKPKKNYDADTTKFIEDCSQLGEAVTDLRTEVKKKVESFFKERIKFIFDKYAFVQRIGWTQYTPGFCDGDPCTFHSTHEYATVNGDPGSEESWTDEYEPEGDTEGFEAGPSETLQQEVNEVVEAFMAAFDSDDMYSMFGDNVSVTVTREGIDVADYDPGY